MWPFKKREVVSMDDFVKQFDPAPCGNQKDHFFWTEFERFPCPHCARMKRDKEEQEKEYRMAKKIAIHVVEVMKSIDNESKTASNRFRDTAP